LHIRGLNVFSEQQHAFEFGQQFIRWITASRFCSFFFMFMKLEVLIELFISADSDESAPFIEQWGLLSSTCCFCLVNPAFVFVAAGCFNQQVSLAYIADIDTPRL